MDPSLIDYFEESATENVQTKALSKSLRRQMEKQGKKDGKLARAHVRHPRPLTPRTEKQSDYMDSMRTRPQIFGIGGAGTGKTYVASRFGLQEVVAGNYDKVVITRPTVTRPEHKLGFLPGDAKMKMDPWLVPITSAMKEQVNPNELKKLLQNETIEFVSFEHMRGRTFSKAFVILDEAQNCTISDLRLFLTRVGEDSTVVINGDTDQCDIPNSGLATVIEIARKFNVSADIVEFGPEDVVRSATAKEWVSAFARFDKSISV